jgi:hypothetical protein
MSATESTLAAEPMTETEASPDPIALALEWPKCGIEGCAGVVIEEFGRCLAHLEFHERIDFLGRGLEAIDLRGVSVTRLLLDAVIRALPEDGDVRVAADCRFEDATFVEGTNFRHVRFSGSCAFNRVVVKDYLSFAFCAFEPTYGCMFDRIEVKKSLTFENCVAAGNVFLNDSSVFHLNVKQSSFAKALIILGLKGEILHLEAVEGGSFTLGTSTFQMANIKELRFAEAALEQLEFPSQLSIDRSRVEAIRIGAINCGQTFAATASRFAGGGRLGPITAPLGSRITDCSFGDRPTLTVRSERLNLRGTRFPDGANLVLGDATVNLAETTFGQPSLLTRMEGDHVGPPNVLTAAGADLLNVAVDEVDLRECRFRHAHNLDALRFTPRTAFARSPSGIHGRRGLIPITYVSRRRVLHEEKLWRAKHRAAGWERLESEQTSEAPDAGEIAEYYRSLRRAREGARDEPGAADFYYGEMEMRRLNSSATWSERVILFLYWALSGYGLRASRALGALAVLTAIFTVFFWRTGIAVPGRGRSGFWPAATYALGAITLHPPARILTTAGEGVSVAFRVLGPALVALTLLSIRGRVRR